MAKIFLTGATGYIGGEVLHQLVESHPNYEIGALVRDASKADAVAAVSSLVKVVDGALDDHEIIAREASEADVVLHLAATGHLKSVEAIYQGLAAKVAKTGKPTFWVQISGASALAVAEIADASRVPGTASDAVFDDVDGVDDIRALIQKHPVRVVDNYVLSAAAQTPLVKTALIVGPNIFGEGRGPVNKRSVQIPALAKATLERGRGLRIGPGLSRWGGIYIGDVGSMIVRLVENAVAEPVDERLWGVDGVYLGGIDELTFGDISAHVAAAACEQGFIESDEVDQVSGDEAESLLPHAVVLYATNARGAPRRAKEILGWVPTGYSLETEIPRAVSIEARALGLV